MSGAMNRHCNSQDICILSGGTSLRGVGIIKTMHTGLARTRITPLYNAPVTLGRSRTL